MGNVLRQMLGLNGPPDVLGINARNGQYIQRFNPRRYYSLVDDKLKTKTLLEEAGVPVPQTHAVFRNFLEASTSAYELDKLESCVIKPSQGSGGAGILVLVKRTRRGWFDASDRFWNHGEIGRHLSDIVFGNFAQGRPDVAFVEERLLPAPFLGDQEPPGLPDVRVLTLAGRPVQAMLRLPTVGSSGKANLHQGAVGVGIDLNTGRTVHAIWKKNAITQHPNTGAPLVGLQVEAWRDVLEVARRAARAIPLGYLGVDVCLDRRHGALVLEANGRPGLEIQNANQFALQPPLRRLLHELNLEDAT